MQLSGGVKPQTMNTTVEITIEGIALEVTGHFSPEESQTRDYPGCSSEFDIESIKLADPDADIYDLLVTVISMEDIENAAIEALGERETPDEYWGGY